MNVTIGQYYPTKSIIHRLDPRLKILSTLIFITALFLSMDFSVYLFSAISLGVVVLLTKIPFGVVIKSLRGIIFILIFTSILNMFFNNTGKVLFQFHFIKITVDGLVLSFKIAFRLIILVMSSCILTLTTNPIQITSGIEYLLRPFKKIGVPAHEIAMMMTICLRFIPTLSEELEKIKKAQMSRGADFDTGGIIKRAKNMIPLLIPIFISSFKHADELAMAMESRCYRGDVNRTDMRVLKLTKLDYWFLFFVILFFIIVLIIR